MLKSIIAVILVSLITGKAVVGAISHMMAWIMAKLADRGTFKVNVSYAELYARHDLDIEH